MFGGDYYKVVKGKHQSTWRVICKVNNVVYVDYTKPDGVVPYDVIDGHKYVKLSHVKKHIDRTLDDPSAHFRHVKDVDVLNRIKIFEREFADTNKKITFLASKTDETQCEFNLKSQIKHEKESLARLKRETLVK